MSSGSTSPVEGTPKTGQRLRPRQEMAVRRFTQYCKGQWGTLLFHKVGTGKTISSMLIALNSLTQAELNDPNVKIFVVAPTSAIFQNFTNDLSTKLANWSSKVEKLVDYPYPDLIRDINNRSETPNFKGSVIIFDEAHRLLGREIYNSMEAGSRVERHPILEDIFFINRVKTAKKCIIMTGTPIQVDVADICRFLNFVSQTNDFTTQKYAPVTFNQTTLQYAATIVTNAAKAYGGQALGAVTTAAYAFLQAPTLEPQGQAPYLYDYTMQVDGLTRIGNAVAAPMPGSEEVINNSYLYMASYALLTTAVAAGTYGYMKYKARETKGGATRRLRRGGGLFGNAVSYLTGTAGSVLDTGVKLSIGPAQQGKPLTDTVSKFLIDMGINQFQEIVEELYNNVWNVEQLAKDGSKYISVYDPEIQVKLKNQSYDRNILTDVSRKTNFSELEDSEVKLDMPQKLYRLHGIQYNEFQLDLLRNMVAGELPLEWKAILNIDRYENASPDVKYKYKFIRTFARMLGNLTEDNLKYYTVINQDGTDYDVYERATGRFVPIEELRGQRKVLFQCPKFDECLAKLLKMRETGKMFNPEPVAVEEAPTQTEEEDLARELGEEIPTATVQEEDMVELRLLEGNVLNQPHYKNGKQYLPLVYSYTEDFGLSLFCIYLKCQGYSYVLAHTKQSNTTLKSTIDRGKSFGPNPGFEPFVALQRQETNPLCVLIHPTMTEGYDFVYNPAIFVLEPCNTFGDQEQVYGRVLRSYSAQDIESFQGQPRKKLIYQFECLTENDNLFLTKAKLVMLKLQFWKSRIFITPQNLFQSISKGKIESPDVFAITRLEKEERYLTNFKKAIEGGIDFSNIHASIACLGANTVSCDPIRGTSCSTAPSISTASSTPDPTSNPTPRQGGSGRRFRRTIRKKQK